MGNRIQLDGREPGNGGAFVELSSTANTAVTTVMAEENIGNFWDALAHLGKNREDYQSYFPDTRADSGE